MNFITYCVLTISTDYNSSNTFGVNFSMYNDDILKHLDKLLKSAIINNQNKIKFYSRGEKEILKTKRDERFNILI
jgi:hypothetical protein